MLFVVAVFKGIKIHKDIINMINLANVAFTSFIKVWIQGSKVSLEQKLQIYEAQVITVLLYNSSCWAASKFIMEKLDIIGNTSVQYLTPALYKRRGTKPL